MGDLLAQLAELAYANPAMAAVAIGGLVLVGMAWGVLNSSYRYR